MRWYKFLPGVQDSKTQKPKQEPSMRERDNVSFLLKHLTEDLKIEGHFLNIGI
jgi:hypothetical protein